MVALDQQAVVVLKETQVRLDQKEVWNLMVPGETVARKEIQVRMGLRAVMALRGMTCQMNHEAKLKLNAKTSYLRNNRKPKIKSRKGKIKNQKVKTRKKTVTWRKPET